MKYKKQIDPELRPIARKIPYNRAVIRCANIYQSLSFRLSRVPEEAVYSKITVEGYRGLKFKVDIFEPRNAAEKLPGLIYAHGGAFSYKACAYQKQLACMYAARANCRVFFPDYHLTPQYPYPAAYEDALALYKHITENAKELGVDREKLAVAGDSAGAAIAALVCNRYEQENLRRPYLQMLIYPLTDITMQTDSMRRFADTPLWNAKNNRRMWSYYCKGLSDEDAYAVSPHAQ